MTDQVPYLLMNEEQKAAMQGSSLLAASLSQAMENNADLRAEVERLKETIEESKRAFANLNFQLALLATLQKDPNGKNPLN